jgi:hypothetical protein
MRGGTMGLEGATLRFMAWREPSAARESPARGPAAAKGEIKTGSISQKENRKRCTTAEIRRETLRIFRSRARRSSALR